MAHWDKLQREYITTGISYRALAEKYGVSFSTLRDRAKREKWPELRESQRNKTVTNTVQKTAERLADVEAEVAAIRQRMYLKLMQEVERLTDELITSGEMNSTELRKLVQCFRDLDDVECESIGNEEQHNSLIDAIRARIRRIN